ncbi:MAG TPA: hypothetical protein VHZ95_17430, partial [Polyangiales bacterium]|nr:hypothetical protein [Polyangiales bacterium]
MLRTTEVAVKHLVERMFLFAGFCLLAACTDSPSHHSLASAITVMSDCPTSCDDGRSLCRNDCHDTDCNAECEATWEHCQLDCPDGSIASES